MFNRTSTLLASLLLGGCPAFLGCGSAQTGQASAADTECPGPASDGGSDAGGAAHFVGTGVGNTFTWSVTETFSNDGTSYNDQIFLSVGYIDGTGYFKDASGNEPATVSAYVGLNLITYTAGGDPGTSAQNQTITLTQQADGSYTGSPVEVTVKGYDDGANREVLDSAALAFSSPAGVWDSNESANYFVSLGDIQ